MDGKTSLADMIGKAVPKDGKKDMPDGDEKPGESEDEDMGLESAMEDLDAATSPAEKAKAFKAAVLLCKTEY